MPTIRQVWKLIQHCHFTFSIDLMDAYLHSPVVNHHGQFYACLAKQTLPVEGFVIWAGYGP